MNIPNSSNNKILIIDDNKFNAEITELFVSEKYMSVTCEDETSALEAIRKEKYLAILLDVSLGGISAGAKTAENIRKVPGYDKVPIIGFSALLNTADIDATFFDHIIEMPFEQNELLSLIAAATNG